MRQALQPVRLRAVYDRVAGHYDFLHGLLTARSDQRGRCLLVEKSVRAGDRVLDCGAGTGSTGLLAAQAIGNDGQVSLLDMSDAMLGVARDKAAQLGVQGRVTTKVGDLQELPFADGSFDVVLSSYSLCPVVDPARGAQEMFRVTKPGGRIGIAHSTDPTNPVLKWMANGVENLVWHFPSISLGCRSVSVRPMLEKLGCTQLYERRIGVPLWPFLVFVMQKPGG